MHRFKVARFVGMTSTAIFLASCAFFFSHTSSSELTPLDGAIVQAGSYFQPVAGETALYRSADSGAYLVAIRECDREKQVAPLTRARQLFVGFQGVRVIKDTDRTINETRMHSVVARATLDGKPIAFVNEQVLAGDCIIDLVLWIHGEASDSVNEESLGALAHPVEELDLQLPAIVSQVTG